MDNASDPLILWAKRGIAAPDGPFHPLICHMIDVAEVAKALWTDVLSPATKRWFADGLGETVDVDGAGRWAVSWVALHDIGKACRPFQEQLPFNATTAPHGVVSTAALAELLTYPPFGLDPVRARLVATVVGGHHGVLPVADAVASLHPAIHDAPWPHRRHAIATEIARLYPPPASAPCALDNARALWLAGLTSVCDWIGSTTDFFPFASQTGIVRSDLDVDRYRADRAAPSAARALRALGWTAKPTTTAPKAFRELFPAIATPNHLQETVTEVARRLTEPGLVIIEAPMGEGKTEAALFLADHGIAALGMRGHYVALPTMATSNQMFNRVTEYLRCRYDGETVQTQLLHGHASLSAELKGLEQEFRSFLTAIEGISDTGDLPSVVASTWFSKRKHGLLAPFGVGTIDQSLLAILQTKHVFVRLFGLATKTVVFDEVHAYDTYMSTLIERLLSWLAALGCTVVLLSATLPRERRQRLLRAYQTRAPVSHDVPPDVPQLRDASYPCVSWAIGGEIGWRPIGVSTRGTKRLRVRWIAEAPPADRGFLADQLAEALVDGGCAAVVCNTVRRAQETYLALKCSGHFAPEELDLFHARYLFKEREVREARCLGRFGKDDEAGVFHRPHRMVLVATQVIEQSLDLDFDLMVTELAPVDLVLQRAGRLHRHPRPNRPPNLHTSTLWVIAPTVVQGMPVFGTDATAVYDEHVLLRSWLALHEQTSLAVPEDVTRLIEAVYAAAEPDPTLAPEMQAYWRATAQRHAAEAEREVAEARSRCIKYPGYGGELARLASEPREEDQPELHTAFQALTRLAEPAVTVVCFEGSLGCARFDLSHPPVDIAALPSRHLGDILRNSVSLSHRGVVWRLLDTAVPASWARHSLLRSARPLALDPSGEVGVGRYRIRLDPELGLLINARDTESGGPEW